MNCETSSAEPGAGVKTPRLYKVTFDLPHEIALRAPASMERIWVKKTSEQLQVEVMNTPFFVQGVALGDIVRVSIDNVRRELIFERLVRESGHSAIRLIVENESNQETVERLLNSSGCGWEIDSSGILWALDVPPGVDYLRLRGELAKLAMHGVLVFEEGALGKGHRRELSEE